MPTTVGMIIVNDMEGNTIFMGNDRINKFEINDVTAGKWICKINGIKYKNIICMNTELLARFGYCKA